MNTKINIRFGILSFMILLAALSRLFPHPPNVAPIAAMGLFGSAYFSRKYWAFLVPLAAMWLSDLWLNNIIYAKMYPDFYSGFAWWGNTWVYASFFLIVWLGFGLLKQVKVSRLVTASLLSSSLFFVITNFGVWLNNPTYPQTMGGLGICYAMGIPFFWNTLLGDLFYTGILFGVFEWLSRRYPVLQTERIKIS